MSEHTKEPWRQVGGSGVYTDFTDKTPIIEPLHVASCWSDVKAGIDEDANARRIVACVNACAGTETERLEKWLEVGSTVKSITETAGKIAKTAERLRRKEAEARTAEAERLLRDALSIAEKDTGASIVTAVSNLHDIETMIRAFLERKQ